MNRLTVERRRILDGSYKVGIVEDCNYCVLDDYFSRIHWINTAGYNEGWFADPFIVDANPSIITLFVEEYQFNCNKGRLSLIKVNRANYRLMEVKPILQLNSHLSFPYPIIYRGELYVCPENCAANEVAIYRFDGNKLVEKIKILSGKYVDTQIIHYGNWFYLFTSKVQYDLNGGSTSIEIFRSKELLGPYNYFQTISNNKPEERGAGLIFNTNHGLIRPTQNCTDRYGNGVIFNQLEFINNKFKQTQITRINANPQFKNGLCFHTYSVFDNLTAVDGFDFPFRAIGKITPYIYGMKRLLSKYLNR